MRHADRVLMSLPAGEPGAGPWRIPPIGELVSLMCRAAGAPDGRPRVVAVDGRSAAGRSTPASRLHEAVPASAVVRTDDVAVVAGTPTLAHGHAEIVLAAPP
jgi:hypothetical protein